MEKEAEVKAKRIQAKAAAEKRWKSNENDTSRNAPRNAPPNAEREGEWKENHTSAGPPAPDSLLNREASINNPAGRARDLLSDTLATACGNNPSEMTEPAKKACGVALAAIHKVMPDLAPDEIQRRAAKYRKLYRDAALTPSALCKHWAECGNGVAPPPNKSDVYTEPTWDWRSMAETNWPGSTFSGEKWLDVSVSIRADILRLRQ